MASVTGANIDKPTIDTGETATITPQVDNQDQPIAVSLTLDGSTFTGNLTQHEEVTLSVDPADTSKRGKLVATIQSGPASVALSPDGSAFLVTAG